MLHRARALLALLVAPVLLLLAVLPAHALVPTVLQRSSGQAFMEAYKGLGEYIYVRLDGTISFGNRAYVGQASGAIDLYRTGQPFDLRPSGSAQTLSARCRLSEDGLVAGQGVPLVVAMVCTGHVDDGPVRTTALTLVLPQVEAFSPSHGGEFAWQWRGSFVG